MRDAEGIDACRDDGCGLRHPVLPVVPETIARL